MTYTDRAKKMRPYIEQAANALDDKTVSLAPELLGTLTGDGSLVKAGTRINWHGKIKKPPSTSGTPHRTRPTKRLRSGRTCSTGTDTGSSPK